MFDAINRKDLISIPVILLAGFLYMYFVNSQKITSIGGDQLVYDQLAVNILQGHGFSQVKAPPYVPSIARTPLYPLFLAGIYGIFGYGNYEAVRAIQICLMLFSALIAFGIASLVFENKYIAYACLILCCFHGFDYGDQGVYGYLLTEPLTIFLVNASILFVALAHRFGRTIHYVLAGSFLALSMLTRPSNLLFPLAILFFFVYFVPLKQNVAKIAAFFACIAAIILPWTARNYLCFKRIILLSASLMGTFIFTGSIQNNPDFFPYASVDFDQNGIYIPPQDLEAAKKQLTELYTVFNYGGAGDAAIFKYDDELKKIGLRIIDHHYLAFARKWAYRILGHWSLGDLANILNGINKDASAYELLRISAKVVFFSIIAITVFKYRKNQLALLLVLFPAYNTLIYTPFCAVNRYALPAHAFIIIFFSAAIYHILHSCAGRAVWRLEVR